MASSDVASNPRVPNEVERGVEHSLFRAHLPNGRQTGVIREGLAGKRIAVTGTTGFLGTALVERLLRTVPDASSSCWSAPGAGRPSPSGSAARSSATTPSTGCDRARRDGRVRRDDRSAGAPSSPATSAPTASASTTPAAPRWPPATSSSTRPPRSPSTRRSTSPSRSTCSARRASRTRCRSSASPPPRRGVDLLRRRQPPRAGARGAAVRRPVLPRHRLAQRGRRRPPGARRRRGREPHRRDAGQRFRGEARRELGAAGAPAAGGEDRAAADAWVNDRMVEAGRARAVGARLARRLRLHQGARRAGAGRDARRRAGVDRAAVDHRVGAGRAAAGLDPRLPHGRAGDHLLRPRPAEGVPRRARGHRRRDPRRPRGRRDRARWPPAGRRPTAPVDITQVASGSANPLQVPAPRRHWCSGWFTEHPLYDTKGQPIVVPEWTFPGRGRVQGQLKRAKTSLERAERVLQALPLRGKQAELSARLEERREEVERALVYVELYGAYAECEAVYGVDRLLALWDALDPAEPRRRSASTPASSTGTTTSARSTCRRWSSTPGCAPRPGKSTGREPRATGCGARCCPPSATSPPSTSRTRSSRRTWSRPTRGWPPAACRADDRLRFVARTLAEAPRAARPRPPGPRRLPALLLPPLRGRPGRPARRGRGRDVQRADPHQALPGRHPAGARAPRARPPHAC